MRLLQINDLTLPDNDAMDDLSFSGRSVLQRLRGGAFDQDGPDVVLDTTTITRRVLYIGTLAEIDQQIDALKAELVKGRAIVRARLRDNRERLTFAKFTRLRLGARTQDYLCRQEVTIELVRDWPYWFAPDVLKFFDTGLKFDDGHSFDDGYTQFTLTYPTQRFNLFNGGSAPGIWEALTIIPDTASSLADFEIVNHQNFFRFAYTGTVAAQTRLDLDFLAQSAQYDSGDAFDNVEVDAAQPDWMRLEVGGNNLSVTGTVVGTVRLYWLHVDLYL